jgi:hypothetical protein
MNVQIKHNVAVIHSDEPLITDAQSALDLVASAYYEHSTTKVAINKSAVSEAFFRLSSGLAGEVVQKFVNYHFKVAIIGDFSGYTSKPLHDYIYECNQGNHLFFVANEDEALRKLGERE